MKPNGYITKMQKCTNQLDVSKNMGKPLKSPILTGFSIIFTIHFGGNTPYVWKYPTLKVEIQKPTQPSHCASGVSNACCAARRRKRRSLVTATTGRPAPQHLQSTERNKSEETDKLQESTYVPWSKVAFVGDGHPTFNRNPYNGYINPYYWVDDHPLLCGNNGSLYPGTYNFIILFTF